MVYVMKKIILLFFTFCFGLVYCQYTIHYSHTKKIGDRKFDSDAVLYVDFKEEKSLFTISQFKNLLKHKFEIDKITGDTIKVLSSSDICNDSRLYFNDFKNKEQISLLYDVTCDSKTLIKETLFQPKWVVSKGSKKYKKWNVYEAKASINDRNWTVYFTNEYKELVNFGPWKLVNLPGLVVYASDETKKYYFELEKIEKGGRVTIPFYPKKSNFQDYVSKVISNHKMRMTKKISKEFSIPENEVDLSKSPKYETLDFIEK